MSNAAFATVFLLEASGDTVDVAGHLMPSWSRYAYVEQAPGATPQPYGWSPVSSIEVRIEVREGAPVVTEFSVKEPGDTTITAASLRSIPYKDVINRVLGAAAAIPAQTSGRAPNPMTDAEHAEIQDAVSGSFNRRRVTTSLLHQVANIARANPDQPTKQVAEQLYTGHRNATRWLAEARKRGFLDPIREEDNQ